MRALLLTLAVVFAGLNIHAQSGFEKTAADAFLVTRMAAKYHLQPKPLDQEFSASGFDRILNALDKDKIFFTRQDRELLLPFRLQLHQEVLERKTAFLRLLSQLYEQRLKQADSLIAIFAKTPADFSGIDKLTLAERNSYPDNERTMAAKFGKVLKAEILQAMLRDIATEPGTTIQKKQLDSLEVANRKKLALMVRRGIRKKLERPGGLAAVVGELYCETIAGYYDPHTNYFSVTTKENFESGLGQKSMMFGFGLEEDEGGNVSITSLKPGSPAYQCGQLNEGDKIQSVQWEGKSAIEVSGASLAEVADILETSNYEKVRFTIKKQDGTTREVVLAKAAIEDEDNEVRVKSFVLRGDKTIGYISLPAFYGDWENGDNNVNGCANDVAREVVKLKKENISALVLDLRYNGGGSIQEAIELAGIFIDAGPMAMAQDRGSKVYSMKDANRGTIYDGPLLVMVNGYSASASELVAATLQDYNRAVVVGSTTYGKATGQLVLPIDTTISLEADFSNRKTSGYLKLTTMKLYRVTGATAQFTGVTPDIVFPDLMDVDPRREANTPFALPATAIDRNKYYTPLPAIDKSGLVGAAKKITDTMSFFINLSKYIERRKSAADGKDIVFNWKLALDEYRSLRSGLPSFSSGSKSLFTVTNHQYDLQRMMSKELKETSDTWKEYLEKDPYLQATWLLALEMIKKP